MVGVLWCWAKHYYGYVDLVDLIPEDCVVHGEIDILTT